jgi:hypothetical protein
MARIGQRELASLQGADAEITLLKLADHAKRDPSFNPISSKHTSRWHATVSGREYELLLTGSKFYDTRAKRGGGGAIDLAMHLYQLDFKMAVERLRTVLCTKRMRPDGNP